VVAARQTPSAFSDHSYKYFIQRFWFYVEGWPVRPCLLHLRWEFMPLRGWHNRLEARVHLCLHWWKTCRSSVPLGVLFAVHTTAKPSFISHVKRWQDTATREVSRGQKASWKRHQESCWIDTAHSEDVHRFSCKAVRQSYWQMGGRYQLLLLPVAACSLSQQRFYSQRELVLAALHIKLHFRKKT